MDRDFWLMLLKIVVFLPPILFLVYGSLKYGGGKLQSIQSGKFIKILEKAVISKENSLLVVKIGEKGYVVSSTSSKIELLYELSVEELAAVAKKNELPQYSSIKDFLKNFNKKEGHNLASKKKDTPQFSSIKDLLKKVNNKKEEDNE